MSKLPGATESLEDAAAFVGCEVDWEVIAKLKFSAPLFAAIGAASRISYVKSLAEFDPALANSPAWQLNAQLAYQEIENLTPALVESGVFTKRRSRMLVDLTPEEIKYLLDGMTPQAKRLERNARQKIREEGLSFLVPATDQMKIHNDLLRKFSEALTAEEATRATPPTA